jgi:hypothetical protein
VKWKPQFGDYLTKLFMEQLRGDVIIRDMRRMDTYPDVSKGRGISSWFRRGLLDTYERGIMVGLRWEGITKVEEGYRYGDWTSGEEGELTARKAS